MAMIATWRMSLDGVRESLSNHLEAPINEQIITAIHNVEDNPLFHSVGYGGLPNAVGKVELDAAYMNGKDLSFGAVMALEGYANPIDIAYSLSLLPRNNILCGKGASIYADTIQAKKRDNLFEAAILKYNEAIDSNVDKDDVEAYDGHDTVCIGGIDQHGNMGIGVSTSGLFLKSIGRVGDSPIIGSGCYVDSEIGLCAATGVGEDILRGCLSIRVVDMMSSGMNVQAACETVLMSHSRRLAHGAKHGSMSIIAMDNEGNYGAATTKDEFSFVYGTEASNVAVYLCKNNGGKQSIELADESWLKNYLNNLLKGSGT